MPNLPSDRLILSLFFRENRLDLEIEFLQLDLVGTTSNRDAVGAKVYVTAGGVTQYREQNGGYHRWSQNFMRLHFGLKGRILSALGEAQRSPGLASR